MDHSFLLSSFALLSALPQFIAPLAAVDSVAPPAPVLVPAEPTLPPPADQAYEGKIVSEITIRMENLPVNTTFDPKVVFAKMTTKEGDPFSQSAFDVDLKMLSEEYDQIEPRVEYRGGRLTITLRLWARPKISQIRWEGNTECSAKTLGKELGIKSGAIYNAFEFNKGLNKVKEYYLKKGYFESEITYSLLPNPSDNTVEVVIAVREGLPGLIDSIVFKGFTSDEESKILDMIHTKEYNFLWSWLTSSGIYREEMIDQDKMTIAALLQNEGYADARITIATRSSTKEDRIILEITAERGDLYHFGSVTFIGNTLFSDAQIERCFLARPEGLYSPEKLRDTAQAIKDLYGRKGYIETDVEYEAIPDAEKPIYNVAFRIEEGGEFKIGLIHVFGNVQTKSHVILRESLLIPGETFDSLKLKKTQERLENIGYFKSVNVYAVRTPEDESLGENYRDVYIEVQETTTGNASVFFGLSSGDGVFGGLDIAETNFNIAGFKDIFSEGPSALRGGGEYAHAKLQLGSKERVYSIAWLDPYFLDSPWRLGFDANLTQTYKLQAKKYGIDSVGGSLFASYPINAYWTFGWKYRVKHADIKVSKGASHKEREVGKGTGNVSATGVSMNYDSSDRIVKPRNGFRSALEAEFAGVGGNFAFFKYGYINTFYQQLWSKGIMKYRWDFKFIQPTWWTRNPHQIPVSERFFIGGENTVRGYRTYDLGNHFSDGDPVGGISTSVFSMEYLQEIFSFLDGFLFIDAGSIKLQKFHLGQYKVSAGFGVRIDVMNQIPITLGYGIPINATKHDKVQKFYFSMGGQF